MWPSIGPLPAAVGGEEEKCKQRERRGPLSLFVKGGNGRKREEGNFWKGICVMLIDIIFAKRDIRREITVDNLKKY